MADPLLPKGSTPPPLAESLPEEDLAPAAGQRPRPSAAPRSIQPGAAAPATNEEAEKLIRDANLMRMRGQLPNAEMALRRAIELAPTDPQAFELMGDMCRQTGRPADALTYYTRASELLPPYASRTALESKMARMVLEKNSAAIGRMDNGALLKGNPGAAITISLFVPGIGQILSGQVVKGAIIFGVWLISLILVFVSPQGKAFMNEIKDFRGSPPAIDSSTLVVLFFLLINFAAWLYALIDVAVTSRRAQEE